MEKRLSFKKVEFVFILLFIVFSAWIVVAASDNLAPSTASAGDDVQMLWFNVSNETGTGENATLDSILVNLTGTASPGNIMNVTLNEGGNIYYNDSGNFPVTISIGKIIEENTNFTLNFTLNSSATWNVTFGANITEITNSTTNATNTFVVYSALPYNSSLVRVSDTTAPTVSAPSKISSTRTTIKTDFEPAKCSDGVSGVKTCELKSSDGTISGDEITGLACNRNYDVWIVSTNNEGLTTESSKISMSTNSCGGGSGEIVPQPPRKSHAWAMITPGVSEIMKDFDAEIGIREITINVNNPAQDVKITVTKHDGKPAEVSVEKEGKVYQYLEIDAENLEGNLENAVVQFRVEKSWASQNNLQRDGVSVFRYNEAANRWDELETVFAQEGPTFYYYDVELSGFSFFAIGESTVMGEEEVTPEPTPEEEETERSLTWLWILIAVAIIAGAAYFGDKSRKR